MDKIDWVLCFQHTQANRTRLYREPLTKLTHPNMQVCNIYVDRYLFKLKGLREGFIVEVAGKINGIYCTMYIKYALIHTGVK